MRGVPIDVWLLYRMAMRGVRIAGVDTLRTRRVMDGRNRDMMDISVGCLFVIGDH